MQQVIIRIAFLLLCVAAAVRPLAGKAHENSAAGFPGWPREWDGRELIALPLTDAERAWSSHFPGAIGKFSDGERELLVHWVKRATRQLHSSTDCFRGLGYSVRPKAALRDPQGRTWTRFTATRANQTLLLRERIVDDRGREWTDVSAWFWSVALGQSTGPWWSVTLVESPSGAQPAEG